MGLISKTIKLKWINNMKKYYENKGYIYTKQGDEFEIKVEDLPDGSNIRVKVQCDCETCMTPIKNSVIWQDYLERVKKHGKYYCQKCAIKLYGKENIKKSLLNNSMSFKQWCINNNHQDILDRWDYEKNDYLPSQISYGTAEKFYFKCARGLHLSELKNIHNYTNGQNGALDCDKCNSFAQWGIDNICSDFLDKYWDYNKNIVNPWEINYCYNKKVWIRCLEKDYHGSYNIDCAHFTIGRRCSYCGNHKVHHLDSLGNKFPKALLLWSDKNVKTPYEYAPSSGKKVWWKCENNRHEDYYRSISNCSKICDFRCPECQCSKGEIKINDYLRNNNFIKIISSNLNIINIDIKQNDKYYLSQKEFNGLIGKNNGNLSYDFYLPYHNLLIEYQGEQHEKPVDFYGEGIKKAKKQFEKQKEHDNRKRLFAKEHNIKLLEIWYWDYDNIEEILDKELNINF